MEQSNQPTVVVKNGELTGRLLYKVRGDHVWVTTPREALRVHYAGRAFWANYGRK